MGKKCILASILLLCAAGLLQAQGSLTLERCRAAAREVSRAEEAVDLSDSDLAERKKLIRTPYLPQAHGYGSVFYQSDAPDPASFTDLPFTLYPMPKLQFHVGVMVSQTIYAGGSRKVRTDLAEVDSELEKQSIEGSLIEADRAVDELFLGILLMQKQEDILKGQKELLERKLESAREAFEAGKIYRTDVLRLEAGLSSLNSSIDGLVAERASAEGNLAALTGLEIGPETRLELPQPERFSPVDDPSLKSLELQEQRANLSLRLSLARCLPKLSLWGTMGFGQWSLDFFRHDPDVFGVVGLGLSIPLTSWQDYFYSRNLRNNALARIDIQRENLERRRSAELSRYDGAIARYDAMLDGAREAVAKYEELASEMDRLSSGGEAPVSEYIDALSELSSARLEQQRLIILRIKEQLKKGQYTL